MIKFFHTADIHLGVENYGRVDPKTGIHSRLSDFSKSLQQCIDLAKKEKIDFFLFCGDAYKTAFPSPTQQKIFISLLLQLKDAGIPVVSVIGNHDHPLSFGKTNSIEILNCFSPSEFYVFSKPGILKLKTKSGPIQIVGIPWPTRHNIITHKNYHLKSSAEIIQYLSKAVGQIIKSLSEQLDPNIPSILAGHLTVSTGIFSGSEKCAIFGNDPLFLPSQLALKPFDYVALGHLHRHQNLNSGGYPAVVYSGSIEKIDFGERRDKKGFCSVIINTESNEEKCKEKRCSFEFVRLKTRPMVQIEIKLKHNKDQTEQLLEEIEKHEIDGAIVKIIYHVPEGKDDRVDLQEIQKACSCAMHLVSITPVRKAMIREKRAILNINMGLNTLLEKYLEAKKYSDTKIKKLLQKSELLQK